MSEIHDAIGPMGNLTSFNVLVDRRWTCRIADYGLDRFKEPNPMYKPTLSEEETYKSELASQIVVSLLVWSIRFAISMYILLFLLSLVFICDVCVVKS